MPSFENDEVETFPWRAVGNARIFHLTPITSLVYEQRHFVIWDHVCCPHNPLPRSWSLLVLQQAKMDGTGIPAEAGPSNHDLVKFRCSMRRRCDDLAAFVEEDEGITVRNEDCLLLYRINGPVTY